MIKVSRLWVSPAFIVFALLAVASLGIVRPAFAGNVSGILASNTTWSLAGSPYVVTADVQVPSGMTLTIEAGVTVKFSGAYKIYVQGAVVASGTSGQPITFTSSNAGVSSGATMLKFEGANLANSQLSYVKMSYAAKAILLGGGGGEFNPGIACTGTLTVDHLDLSNAEVRTGGYATAAKLVLTTPTVTNATLIGQYPLSEPIEVSNGTITNSTINADAYNKGIKVTGSSILNTQLLVGCCSARLDLVSCTVTSSQIMNGYGSPSNGPLTITDSTLINTTVDLPDASATVSGSSFTFGASVTPKVKFASATVSSTTFVGNGSGVGLELAPYYGYQSSTISGSTFSDFSVGVKVSTTDTSCTFTFQPGNTFLRNSTYNVQNLSSRPIAAVGNDWGTTDPAEIAAKLYDYVDDISRGLITTAAPTAPTITTQPGSVTAAPGANVSFTVAATGAPSFQWRKNGADLSGATGATLTLNNIQASDAATYTVVLTNSGGSVVSSGAVLTISSGGPTNVSGILNANTTWTVANQPYTVTADVQIPSGVTLTIEAGVTVKFSGAYKIYVQGAVVANGTSGQPITFTSSNAGVSSGATMLKFEGANLANSQLSYVKMSYAAKAILLGGGGGEFNPGIACTGTLTVDHLDLNNAEVRTGGYATAAKLVLTTPTVTNATLIGQYPLSEPIEVSNGTITNSTINADAYNKGIKVTGSSILNTQLLVGCCGAKLDLVSSTVTSSQIMNGYGSPTTGPLTITDSTLVNTTVDLPDASATVSGSSFTFGASVTPKVKFASATVSSTTFVGNGSGVGLELAPYYGYQSSAISGCTFSDFSVGVKVSTTDTSCTFTFQPGNTFLRNSAYNIQNLSSRPIAAQQNYWGVADTTGVALKIYDRADNLERGTVDAIDFLTAQPAAPGITSQPTSKSASPGTSVAFTVAASGMPAPTFQWRKNGVAISGATTSTLTLSNVQNADAATYSVVASNFVGSVTSADAVLTVSSNSSLTAPVITDQPTSKIVSVGSSASFSAAATGSAPLSAQWYKDGVALPGATAMTLALSDVNARDAGVYVLEVTNPAGSVRSAPASLTIKAGFRGVYFGTFPGNAGRWALFVRADGFGTFMAEFRNPFAVLVQDVKVDGAGHFTSISNLISAAGGAAASDLRSDVLPVTSSAAAEVTVSGTVDVGGGISGTISGAYTNALTGNASVGSQSIYAGLYVAPNASMSGAVYVIVGENQEAFIVSTVPGAVDAGSGTVDSNGKVQVSLDSGSTVVATIQAASNHIAGSISSSTVKSAAIAGQAYTYEGTQRIANISTRGYVGTGDNVLIAGFIISGADPKQVLVRAAGPALTKFGVSGVLARPDLALYSGNQVIGQNQGWQNSANAVDIAQASQRMGLFEFPAGGSDSAILTTLAPGGYTAVVRGVNLTSGVGLVEVYETDGTTTRLVNISSRGWVGTGDNVLIAGTIVSGNMPTKVLARAVGPSLARFGVGGVLAAPKLAVHGKDGLLTEVTGWSDDAAMKDAIRRTGAFALDANSKDSALVLTLEPGGYTFVVSGNNGATGVVLMEVYELP